MASRSVLKAMSRLVLAALLFTQVALAAAGCDLVQRSAARAIAGAGEMRCPDHGEPGVPERNANICVVHCTSDAQKVEPAGLVHQPSLAAVVLAVPGAREGWRAIVRRPPVGPYTFAAPPARILFQNLRI